MKLLSTIFLVLAFAAVARAGGGGDGDPTESLPGVVDLTPDTFSQHVNGGKHVLLEFYAPWCGHCKRIVGELKKLGELVQSNPALKSKVVIGKVNADAHRSLGDMFGVQGFPTIKFIARGKVPNKDNAQDYQGARTAEKFLEFILAEIEKDKGFARIDKFTDIATAFVGHAAQDTLLEEAVARKADLTDAEKANADIYISYMKRAIEKGSDYLAKEKARLDKLIASNSVSAAKLEDFGKKVSVLGHFVDKDE